ncbi:MAG: MFS transporter [Alphaproteobacteria bacterium]|nr:MFS transporter [Alphaproteobacteria bacterium]
MSSTSESLPAAPGGWSRDARIIGLIAVAHFTSHIHIMMLPPIFGPVREAFNASYIEIGAALTAFNVVSALLQTPAGFLVDRVGARRVLTAGLILGGAACVLAALTSTYWLLLVAYALLGLANTVYHPADYSILSAAIEPKRIGKAFSIHTFAGYFGSGVAPMIVLAAAAIWGWQGAFYVGAALALASALLLIVAGDVLPRAPRAVAGEQPTESVSVGLDLLMSTPVLRNLFFFLCLAMANGGLQTYAVVALGALHGTPFETANVALSGFLLFSAAGVLVGGIIADRTQRHELVAAAGFACTTVMVLLIGWVNLPGTVLILAMSVGGLLNGIIQPSRDMMVRAVTPPGAFGKVFGFVSTGFNVGGMVGPLLYGWLMDRGEPRAIFALVIVFILLGLVTAITRPRPPGHPAWTR